MATLFELAAKLTLDKSEFDKGVSDADSKGQGLGKKLSGALGVASKAVIAGVGAAATAIGTLTKTALDGYSSYEQLVGGVETLFTSSADKVMQYANVAYKTAGLSANQYMETATSFAASLLQSVGGNTEKAADLANQAIIDMSDNANKMGTDMEAIQNAYMGFSKQNYTMLDNLKLGYGGTKEEMYRLIEDAQKLDSSFHANTETVEKNGKAVQELSPTYADIVQAIHIVQENLGVAGTTAKEASTTIQGSVASMKSAWDNLTVGLADDTQDMGLLINNFVESAVIAVNNIVPRIKVILSGVANLVSEMVGVIGEQLPSLLNDLVPPLIQSATNLFTAVASALPGLMEIIIAQFPFVIQAVSGIIPMILEALLNLLPTLGQVATQGIATIVDGLNAAIPNLIPVATDVILTLVQGLLVNLPQLTQSALNLMMGFAQGVLNAIPQIVNRLPLLIQAIVNFFSSSIGMITNAGLKLLSALVKALPQIINSIVSALPQIIQAIVAFYASAYPQIVQAGITLLVGLIGALPQIINTIVGALPQLISAILNAFSSNIPAIMQAGVQLLTSLIGALPQIIATIVSAVPQIIAGLVNAFASFGSSMLDVGRKLVEGIWQGLVNSIGWIKDKITGWVGDVTSFIKNLFGIHSPSALMRDEVGLMLGRGVAEGIVGSIGDIQDASREMLGAIPDLEGRDFSLNVRRNLTDSYTDGVGRIEEIMRRFEQTIVLQLDDRELGRAVRGYV